MFDTTDKLNYIDLLGAPFKYGGMSVKDGFDCWNLCREIYARLGRDLPSFSLRSDNEKETLNDMIISGKEFCQRLARPEPYCLVTFHLVPKYVTHIGVVLEDCRTFIHILKKSSVSVERLDSIIWRKKIEGFYRWI